MVGVIASLELPVRSGKEEIHQSGSIGNCQIGPQGVLGEDRNANYLAGTLLSHPPPQPLSPQQDSDVGASQKWIHSGRDCRGWGVSSFLELGRGCWIPAHGSGVSKRKPGHRNQGSKLDSNIAPASISRL